jgi:hypothetical protein
MLDHLLRPRIHVPEVLLSGHPMLQQAHVAPTVVHRMSCQTAKVKAHVAVAPMSDTLATTMPCK